MPTWLKLQLNVRGKILKISSKISKI